MDRLSSEIAALFEQVAHERADMHAYQNEAVEFMWETPFSLLMIDLGLGKTISSLTLIERLISRFMLKEGEKILVVAPLKVACEVWPTEISEWRHTAWLNATLIRADENDPRMLQAKKFDRDPNMVAARKLETWASQEFGGDVEPTFEAMCRREIMTELAHSSADIHIINREEVEWLVDIYRDKWPYRTVFIDESSSFKDHKTNRFKALAKVCNVEGLITRMHLLTATPAAETYIHLWAQMYLLDRGKRLSKSITKYRDSYFTYNAYARKYTLRPGCDETILAKIADLCLVMKKKDYLPGIEPIIVQRKVILAPAEIERIRTLERDFVMKLPDGTELEAKTAAILASMLLQMASGSVYETIRIEDFETDDLKKVKKVHHLHDHKIDALREIYEEAQNQGDPILVAYFWQSSLARLKKAFPKGIALDKVGSQVKAWNAGKIPIMFIHPMSAGHGLNLQKGGHNLVFFDLIYSLEFFLQTVGRLDRQGQKFQVVVQLLTAVGTRDEYVAKLLAMKEDAQEKLFVILKRLIRELKKKRALALADGDDL